LKLHGPTLVGPIGREIRSMASARVVAMAKALVAGAASALAASALAVESAPALKLSAELSAPGAQAGAMQPALASAAALAPAPMTVRDYRIGPEDLLEVQVFGVDQLSRTVRVNSRGFVSLPLIGVVGVGGMTAQEAEAAIAQLLAANYLQNPQVSVFIKEYTSQRVTIEGAVNKPGIYPLRGETTLLRSLAIAGGQSALSDMNEVLLFRSDAGGKRVVQSYDVERIRKGELDDPVVVNDDVIVVNRSKTRVMLKDSAFRDVLDTLNPLRW
jgi:polysaccharide export outer membrane protein